MFQAAVLTISDKGSQGLRKDEAGPRVCGFLEEHGYEIVYTGILPDEQALIEKELIRLSDEKVTLIVTTGGTGFSRRDVTPEACEAVCTRMIPGFGEAMRLASSKITDKAWLSRANAGIREDSVIITLPGSPKAAVENLEAVVGPLKHGIEILLGLDSECAVKDNQQK